ncbi:hypothetical protein AYI68_g1977 [Smittium mucronatum]|uniref:Uncharacterized protein n=1 Tax=Smittium mucronatum TaxID=133383 RepID=A0A1R0H3V7_9FUNG|nr:hypothetical protein AYI68_g1977 [Smittium mucronatum]
MSQIVLNDPVPPVSRCSFFGISALGITVSCPHYSQPGIKMSQIVLNDPVPPVSRCSFFGISALGITVSCPHYSQPGIVRRRVKI